MREYYIEANSFAAPFVGDTSHKFVVADSPEAALEQFVSGYTHPAGLYGALCYKDANARLKGEERTVRSLAKQPRTSAGRDYARQGRLRVSWTRSGFLRNR